MALERRSGTSPHLASNVTLGIAVFGLLFWGIAIHYADFLEMGPLGLASILSWPYFAGLGLIVISFSFELLRTPMRTSRLAVHIIMLIVVLFGTASIIEPVARLTDSWIHAGFIQYIVQHGQVLNGYDARFSWPGAFSLGAVLASFTGQANVIAFLRWFPLVIELLYLAPLMVISKFSGVGKRAGWLGIALFYSANWIDQDYFSPQALNYLFFLVVIAVVLASWQPIRGLRSVVIQGRLKKRIVECREIFTYRRLIGDDAVSVWNGATTLALLGLLGLICYASAVSHQLTIYALILALFGCLFARRLGRPELVFVAVLLAVGWLSLGASNYWVGHLNNIFGSAGNIGSTFGSNVTERVVGSNSHRLVVDIRILLTAGLYLLAGIGFLRRSTNSRLLEVLAGAPFVLVVAQNYGGEGLIRVVFFGLPFVALLAASAILPKRSAPIEPLVPRIRHGRYAKVFLRLGVSVLVFGFAVATTVVRGGNDAYESFSTGELAAVNYAYNHSNSTQVIGMIAPYLPFGYRGIGTSQLLVAAGGGTPPIQTETGVLKKYRPIYIILSQSQEAWGELVAGYPKGWEASLESALLSDRYEIVARWRTATVLRAVASRSTHLPRPSFKIVQ